MAPLVVDLGFSEGGFCYIIAWLKYMYHSHTHFQLNHAHFFVFLERLVALPVD